MKRIAAVVLTIAGCLVVPSAAQFNIGLEGLKQVGVPAPSAARPAGLAALSMEQVYTMKYEDLAVSLRAEIDYACDPDYLRPNDPAGLMETEQCVVSMYTSSWFNVVNPPLWKSGVLDGLRWGYVRVLDRALSKIASEPEMVLYRGTQRQIKFVPGQAVQLKGYSSTSPSLETAKWFIGGPEPRIMVIRAVSGKNIMRYSTTGQEEERLLPRNTWVRMERSEIKKVPALNEETGEEELREVEFVYLTELKAP